jgi:amino acid transporter
MAAAESDMSGGQAPNVQPEADAGGPPAPDAVLPRLNSDQVHALREVGRQWPRPGPRGVASFLVDPSLRRRPAVSQPSHGSRLVHVQAAGRQGDELGATGTDGAGPEPGSVATRIRYALLGPPLRSSAIAQERMRKIVALPVLSADALSSVAYGPESMLAILVLAGGAGLGWTLPVSGAIAFLMLAVGLSYRQTIRAYPNGGGSYIVATDNLGLVPGLIAAAGLITDYILTVTVSISSGLDAVSSAIPSLHSAIVPLGLATIVILLTGNLRGVRQAGALFSAPTYAFILAIALLVIVGVVDAAGDGLRSLPRPPLHAPEGLGLLLVLRAFSSGSTAMTGIEAISNAVPVFKPVGWRNARTSLSWMVGLLIVMFAGIIALIELDGIVPQSHQTVLSQLAHRDFGHGPLYIYVQAATALVLLLAANTAYNDFPRVTFLLARDRLAPTWCLRMGDRLAFNNGIIVLSAAAAAVFVAFSGKTGALIPLYAVGVFVAFTLSQAGMVVHWWRTRGPRWHTSIAFNSVGCVLSAIVFLIAAITKFAAGAWLALATIAGFTITALLIRRHLDRVADAVALVPDVYQEGERWEVPSGISHLAIVPVATLNRATMRALAYAASLDQPVLALHISPTEAEGERFRRYWADWGNHLPLEVVESPYRAIVPPTIAYIESLHSQWPHVTLTVIVPELVVRHWWQRGLHENTAPRLRRALEPMPAIIVTSVPFHV